ncbi:xylulokinase [Actinoalloteichus hymeniacidonis]|uniref:Pentulose/hexulose kinase n=1 Tax=Actinoalloteichus hymeniacidonis TaxID=340345 RepID=A0AAC9HQC2_9PSEU|nr:FGGY-family carbohydrate kinase [Actinoalloteichus hymeniacidonis]AOS63399.1 pentulose/hexulose kinase [Actinoalloteichus hymeniacidonis]MBB5908560.1 sugar (pentulose or hexulose) kinase [Actinoalloteichus hymeniacidonis]
MDARPVVCAVDVGTSAVRAAVVTADGRVLRQARRERPPGQGAVTFDALRLWADLQIVLRTLFAEGTEGDAASEDLRALAVAGHIGTVALDDTGEPVAPGGGWADTAGADEVTQGWADPAVALYRAGRPVVTGGAVPALRALRRTDPRAHQRIRCVSSPKDFLVGRLTGVAATDHTSAAYTLGSDVHRRTWSAELIAAADLDPTCFPPQHAATDLVGHVHADAARRTGLPEGLPVACGGPDGTVGAAAVLGSRTGAVVDVAGSTDVLTRILTDPAEAAGRAGVLNPYLDGAHWSLGGATGMTGAGVAHWTALLGLGDPATATAELGAAYDDIPPGCDGLALVPLVTGSRFPDWQPAERGALWGMHERHGPAHVVRAAQEAAAYVVRSAVEALGGTDDGVPVLLAGGTAKSPSLTQLRADVLGRPLSVCVEADVSLRGAALLATVAAGLHPDLRSAQAAMAPRLTGVEPDPERSHRYDELYRRWQRTRQAVIDTR